MQLIERKRFKRAAIHSMSWNAFRGHPLGTRLNTGFQKAFFNQPVLSTTSRRLFLEEFFSNSLIQRKMTKQVFAVVFKLLLKGLALAFLCLKYTSFMLKNRKNCPQIRKKIPDCHGQGLLVCLIKC